MATTRPVYLAAGAAVNSAARKEGERLVWYPKIGRRVCVHVYAGGGAAEGIMHPGLTLAWGDSIEGIKGTERRRTKCYTGLSNSGTICKTNRT